MTKPYPAEVSPARQRQARTALRLIAELVGEGDPYEQLTLIENRAAAARRRHILAITRERIKAQTHLRIIAQLIGEGQPPGEIRNEIIRMIDDWKRLTLVERRK